MNWTVVGPRDKLSGVGLGGEMVMLVTCFWVTVTEVEAMTLPLCAFTVAVPSAPAVSKPALLMVAMFVGVVLQVTCEVTSAVVLLP